MNFIPRFKGFDFFPHDLRLPFMRFKAIAIGASIVAMVLSLALFFTRGLNYGVDFKGGSMIIAQTVSGEADLEALRSNLGGLGLGAVQITTLGAADKVDIRVEQQPGGDVEQQAALRRVSEALGAGYKVIGSDVVGPAVSSELRTTGIIAVLAGLLAIVAYVWFRFEWQFAIGAIVALTHDVLITVGVFSLFQFDFDLSIVAALLTILGYSVNDTVVVSDRIRENLRKYKKMELNELLNLSINETLSRTILTGLSAIVVLLALYIFGGAVIRNFNFAMLLGVIVGTYSSIFIAAPILGYLGVKRDWSGAAAKPVAAPASAGVKTAPPRPAGTPNPAPTPRAGRAQRS